MRVETSTHGSRSCHNATSRTRTSRSKLEESKSKSISRDGGACRVLCVCGQGMLRNTNCRVVAYLFESIVRVDHDRIDFEGVVKSLLSTSTGHYACQCACKLPPTRQPAMDAPTTPSPSSSAEYHRDPIYEVKIEVSTTAAGTPLKRKHPVKKSVSSESSSRLRKHSTTPDTCIISHDTGEGGSMIQKTHLIPQATKGTEV